MDELISIIVPVYNIENYLEKCVNSILTQTYKKIEVILVDDGSTDNSVRMCDYYAQKDSRVRVIHKKNGGLSDARNIAIPLVKGEYILFVDGDDYIAIDYVEYLYSLICKYSADLSICEFSYIYEDGKLINHPLNNSSERLLDQKTALYELLSTRLFSNSASGKMYKKSLLEGIQYPVGRLFEDIATTYRLFLKANNIAFGARALYYYIQHNNTISTSSFSLKKLDAVEYVEEMTSNIEREYPELARMCKCRRIDTYVGVLKQIDSSDNYELTCFMHDKIRKCRGIIFMRECSLKRRLWAITSVLCTSQYIKVLRHL